jgi:phospholipid transport system substrate-binding protein
MSVAFALNKSNLMKAFMAFVVMVFLSFAAEAKAETAQSFIEGLGQKALTSLTGKNISVAEREKRVRTLLRNHFDIPTIGRFAMGRFWRDATPKQRDEYQKLFEDMIVKTYAKRFEDYSGQTLKVKGELKSGKDIIVNSEIVQAGGPPVSVDWRVREINNNFKIIDVIVEGISMSVTQRSDFAAVIQRGGGNVEALLVSLRKRSS